MLLSRTCKPMTCVHGSARLVWRQPKRWTRIPIRANSSCEASTQGLQCLHKPQENLDVFYRAFGKLSEVTWRNSLTARVETFLPSLAYQTSPPLNDRAVRAASAMPEGTHDTKRRRTSRNWNHLDDIDWCAEFRDRNYPGTKDFDGELLDSVVGRAAEGRELIDAQLEALASIRAGFKWSERHWIVDENP